MKVLVVYDSTHGNTEKVARAVAETVTAPHSARAVRVTEVDAGSWRPVDLLVVGSPTQAGRPTKPIQSFIASLAPAAPGELRAAAFDTRVKVWVARLFGYAGPRMARALKAKGAQMIAPPEGFIVTGTQGPLAEGEAERAAAWARGLLAAQGRAGEAR